MSQVIELTNENFKKEVLESTIPVVVDFAAEWCGPCKRLSPIVHEAANDLAGSIKVCHLDVDASQDIALQYDIVSVPTILFFKQGSVADKVVGLVSKVTIIDRAKKLA
jgi:thioredoxin 1